MPAYAGNKRPFKCPRMRAIKRLFSGADNKRRLLPAAFNHNFIKIWQLDAEFAS